jgi:CBS domain containing-hemolysin-like protein
MLAQWVAVGVGLLLIAATAVYVAAEFSFITVDRSAVNAKAGQGDERAESVQVALSTLSTQLSGAQVGISLTTLALGFVMQPALADLIEGPLGAVGMGGAAGGVAIVIALVLTNTLSMVFGELVPKNLAIAEPMGVARSVVGVTRFSTTVFKPLIWALNGTANAVLRMFRIEPQEELRSARSPEELSSLVLRSAEQGTLENTTAGLLARSISFSDKTAADVLTPRLRVRFVRATDPASEVILAASQTGHSRFPVIGADSDDVLGLVHLKRAVSLPRDLRSTVTVRQLMTDVPVVPESMPLDNLLDQLRERGFQLAIVADEYGGTAGLLTLEDVVEELVGEIRDEHDPSAQRGMRLPDGTWLLRGVLRPDEVEELTGVALPEAPGYETVAGLVIAQLGRLAEDGDFTVVPATIRHSATLGVRHVGEPLGLTPDSTSAPDDGSTRARDGLVDPRHPHPASQLAATAIGPDPDSDLPRLALVRLDVIRRVRHRIDQVQLSAIGLRDGSR